MAADAGGIRAGRAYVEMGTNNSALEKGLRAAQARVAAFGAAISSIGQKVAMAGGAAMTGIVGAARLWANQGEIFAEAADRTGASVEALSALAHAAEMSGTNFESLEKCVAKMRRRLAEAAGGSNEARQLFESLGLSIEDLMRLSADQQLMRLADAFSGRIPGPQVEAPQFPPVPMPAVPGFPSIPGPQVGPITLPQVPGLPNITGPQVGRAQVPELPGIPGFPGIPAPQVGPISLPRVPGLPNITGPQVGAVQVPRVPELPGPQVGPVQMPAMPTVPDIPGPRAGLANDTERTARAMEIFGRTGTELIPFLSQGASGIQELTEEARRLGLVWSEEEARAADAFKDSLTTTWRVIQRGVGLIGGAAAPVILEFAGKIRQVVLDVSKWIRENQALSGLIFKVAAGVAVAGAGMIVLGTAIKIASSALSIFKIATLAAKAAMVAFSVVSTTVSVAMAVVKGAVAAVAILFSPAGLLVGGLIAGAAAFVYFSGVGQTAIDSLGSRFSGMGEDFQTAWGGILAAIQSGDLSAALRVAGALLKVVWVRVTSFLGDIWHGFKSFFVETFWSAVYSVSRFFVNLWESAQHIWNALTSFIGSTWRNMVTGLRVAWSRFAGFFRGVWERIRGMFSSPEERDRRIRQAQEEQEREEQGIREDHARRQREAQEATDAQRQAIIDQNRSIQAELERMQESERRARERSRNTELAAAERELAEARGNLSSVVASVRARAAAQPGSGRPRSIPDADVISRNIAVTGTFSSAAARGLSGGIDQEQLAVSRQIAQNTLLMLGLLRERAQRAGQNPDLLFLFS